VIQSTKGKSFDSYRAHIAKSLELWCRSHHIDRDKSIFLEAKFFEDLVALRFNPGGPVVQYALTLLGYSDTQIQKMGRWRGATFKEYIREELACFSEGMSKSMKTKFDFINIAGNAFNTITDSLIDREYDINVSAASAA
jgi:hypothetical protein